MPNPSEWQHAQARRALIDDIRRDKRGWLQHGVAALAVSLLGLGVAGSLAMTGAAEQSSGTTLTATPAARTDRDAPVSRDENRAALDPAKVKSLADQRAEELAKADDEVAQSAKDKASQARDKALAAETAATTAQARKLLKSRAAAAAAAAAAQGAGADPGTGAAAGTDLPAPVATGGKSCMPITGGYSVAARFGQVGSWSRYHTGFDFSAPVGTQLHAPAAGVVTNAGIGSASGWAGNYVSIKYADGTQTLMAHMSTVSVQVGQTVAACQLVGAVGMTGRTFGPHVHFEVYPAGISPGDVYKAVNPVAWLAAHGLRP